MSVHGGRSPPHWQGHRNAAPGGVVSVQDLFPTRAAPRPVEPPAPAAPVPVVSPVPPRSAAVASAGPRHPLARRSLSNIIGGESGDDGGSRPPTREAQLLAQTGQGVEPAAAPAELAPAPPPQTDDSAA